MRVLLVDDCQDDIWFFKEAIKSIDPEIEVIVAYNGVEALSTLESGILPDHIFADIQMPLMNGVEFLTEIQKRFSDVNKRLTMLSGHGVVDQHDLVKLPEHYYSKPNNRHALRGLIHSRLMNA